MLDINKKSDIIIPFDKISDPNWELKTRVVIESLAENWGLDLSNPKTHEEIKVLEDRLGIILPNDLSTFYKIFGIAFIGAELQEFSNIDWLQNIWKDNSDYGPHFSKEDTFVLPYLVTFSYLGNGNMFCFHSETKEVYLFDHDEKPYITKLFSSVGDYLKGCIILSQTDLFGPDVEQNDVDKWTEEIVSEMHGEFVIKKWLY